MTQTKAQPLVSVIHDATLAELPKILLRPGAEPYRQPSSLPQREGVAPIPSPQPPPAPAPVLAPSSIQASDQQLELKVQEGFKKGMEEGRIKGFEQGLLEGREVGAQEALKQTKASRDALAQRVDKLDKIFDSISNQLQESLRVRLLQAEDDMVTLCYASLCKILGEHATYREMVVNTIRQAIEQGPSSASTPNRTEGLSVHIHPQDLDILQQDPSISTWLKKKQNGSVSWIPDDQVKMGGCIIRSNQGSIDLRLETQLIALKELLEQHRITMTNPSFNQIPLEGRG